LTKQRLSPDSSALTKTVCLEDDPKKSVTIGAELGEKQEGALITFLQANVDVFAWKPSDMPGVPREVIEHHLAVHPGARPVQQKIQHLAPER